MSEKEFMKQIAEYAIYIEENNKFKNILPQNQKEHIEYKFSKSLIDRQEQIEFIY